MTQRFEGRSVLVTGGASGIGEAAVRAFAGEGGPVAVRRRVHRHRGKRGVGVADDVRDAEAGGRGSRQPRLHQHGDPGDPFAVHLDLAGLKPALDQPSLGSIESLHVRKLDGHENARPIELV